MAIMSILGFKEFAATLSSYISTNPMSTSSRPVLGTPRLQGEGGFSRVCSAWNPAPPDEFKQRLKKDLELSPEVLEALIQEVDDLILDPIKESLDQLYKNRTNYARQG